MYNLQMSIKKDACLCYSHDVSWYEKFIRTIRSKCETKQYQEFIWREKMVEIYRLFRHNSDTGFKWMVSI